MEYTSKLFGAKWKQQTSSRETKCFANLVYKAHMYKLESRLKFEIWIKIET